MMEEDKADTSLDHLIEIDSVPDSDNDSQEIIEQEETNMLEEQTEEHTEMSDSVEDLDDVLASSSKIQPEILKPIKSTSIALTKVTNTPTNVSSLTKIVPKTATTGIKTIGSSGQIVFIQSPGGATQPIRITSGSGATAAQQQSVLGTTSTGIQLIKTADGNYVQVKGKLTPTSASNPSKIIGGAQAPAGSRIIVKTGGPQRILLQSSPTLSSAVTASTSTTTPKLASNQGTRTVTVAQAQKMGLLSSAKLKELVSAAAAQKQSAAFKISQATSSTVTTTSAANTPKIVAATSGVPSSAPAVLTVVNKGKPSTAISTPTTSGQRIVIQTSDGVQKQVTLPQHLVKLARAGQIKAVNVPGKGLQYVKVNPSSSTASATSFASKMSPTAVSSITSVKVTSQANNSSGSKVEAIDKSQSRQTLLLSPKIERNINQSITTIGGTTIKQTVKTIPKFQAVNDTKTYPQKILNSAYNKLEKEEEDVRSYSKSNRNDSELKYSNIKFELDRSDGRLNTSSTSMHNFGSPRKYQQQSSASLMDTSYASNNSPTQKLQSPPSPDDGLRRKHCNCTKSQCLKLYCDCFANGEFCFNCNCKECYNNLENEEDRQKAIKMCLERNPHAFKPKIGKTKDQTDTLRRHTKGCNCKRSGCLKNYCECYEAKIVCSDNCKCVGCRNVEGSSLNHSHYSDNSSRSGAEKRHIREETPPPAAKKPCNFMTEDVIDATIQCVIAQADECQKCNTDPKLAEQLILEEFGRCLVEIIEFSMKNTDN